MLIFICTLSGASNFFYILRGFFYVFWISGSVKNTLNIRCLYKNSFENTRTYVKIRFFSILMALLVLLFKQNLENTNEIRMVGQSVVCWIVGQSHGLHHLV